MLVKSIEHIRSLFDVNLIFIILSIIMILSCIFLVSIRTTLDLGGISQRRLWICNNKIMILNYRCEWRNVTRIKHDPFFGITYVQAGVWKMNCPMKRMIILLAGGWWSLNSRQVLRFLAARVAEEPGIQVSPEAARTLARASHPTWRERLARVLFGQYP